MRISLRSQPAATPRPRTAELAWVRGRHAELHQRPVLTYVATLIRLAGG